MIVESYKIHLCCDCIKCKILAEQSLYIGPDSTSVYKQAIVDGWTSDVRKKKCWYPGHEPKKEIIEK